MAAGIFRVNARVNSAWRSLYGGLAIDAVPLYVIRYRANLRSSVVMITNGDVTRNSTIFVSDLDGTLLDDEARLSPRSRSHIERIVAAGIPFTVATARAIQSTRPVFDGVELALPVVTFNGAFISRLLDGGFELIHAIDEDSISTILEVAGRHHIDPFVSTNDGSDDHLYYPERRNEGMDLYLAGRMSARDPRLSDASRSKRYLSEQIVCFTFIDQLRAVKGVLAGIETQELPVATSLFENRYSPGWYWLTVRDADSNKGSTTRELMARYGLERHRLVAFGDETNDLDLLREADVGVAVENGVKELKQVADEVIGPNNGDSVTSYILEELRLSVD